MPVSEQPTNERGSVLILALVFLVAAGLIATGLVSFAGNDLQSSTALTNVRSTTYASEDAVEEAIQYVRYQATTYSGTGATCLPNSLLSVTFNSLPVAVYCEGATTSSGREVTFYACPAFNATQEATEIAACTAPQNPTAYLVAQVNFTDYSSSNAHNCKGSLTTSCGTAMTIGEWMDDNG